MKIFKFLYTLLAILIIYGDAFAALGDLYDENILWTKHNLSKNWPGGSISDPRTVKASSENEICVFCHTPHSASDKPAPIWNRNLSYQDSINYTLYTSGSLDASINQPQGTSRLCLSCHDGTIGMGYVRNAPGSGAGSPIQFQNGIVTMPEGDGKYSGNTRLLGTNLSNDHPISFVFDNNVVIADGELILPDNPIPTGQPWSQYLGVKRYPLNFIGVKEAVQCTSCHNPHTTYEKFLRAPIYQSSSDGNPPQIGVDLTVGDSNNIICLSCHKVNHEQWVDTTHAQDTAVLNSSADTVIRPGAGGKKMWEVACLACHDTHTAEGAVKILRNGVEGIGSNTASIENTCFLCHQKTGTTLPNYTTEKTLTDAGAPNIKTQFDKDCSTTPQGPGCIANIEGRIEGGAMNLAVGANHEPVFTKTPSEGVEFSPDNVTTYTHIECVDCHNPHRVVKTNRLQGMKGITIKGEVVGEGYFPTLIDSRPVNPDTGTYEPLVYEICFRCHGNSYSSVFPTNYQFPFQNGRSRWSHPSGSDRTFDDFSLTGYSNKRKEFDPSTNPDWAAGGCAGDPGGINCNTAFHPVAAPGRNQSQQLNNSLSGTDCFMAVLSGESYGRVTCIGDISKNTGLDTTKTIQCTDCHNNNTFGYNYTFNSTSPRGPLTGLNDGSSYKRSTDIASRISTLDSDDPDKPQGPHGSLNKRILRGNYDTIITASSTRYGNKAPMYTWMNMNVDVYYQVAINLYGTHEGQGSTSQDILTRFELCFNCHDPKPFLIGRDLWVLDSASTYSNPIPNPVSGDVVTRTGFWTDSWGWGSLHYFHLKTGHIKCHECHYNVHSNVEAQNTIYGNGSGGQMPPDGNTHLINFAPNVQACCGNSKPRWYYEASTGYYRCQLRCHNMTMDSCKYKPSYNFNHGTGSPNYDSWAQTNYGTDCGNIPISQRRYCRPRRVENTHPAFGYGSCGQVSLQQKWNR